MVLININKETRTLLDLIFLLKVISCLKNFELNIDSRESLTQYSLRAIISRIIQLIWTEESIPPVQLNFPLYGKNRGQTDDSIVREEKFPQEVSIRSIVCSYFTRSFNITWMFGQMFPGAQSKGIITLAIIGKITITIGD